jgi:hypothetical protein
MNNAYVRVDGESTYHSIWNQDYGPVAVTAGSDHVWEFSANLSTETSDGNLVVWLQPSGDWRRHFGWKCCHN